MSSRDISEIRWQMVQSRAIRSCGTLTHLFIIWLLLFCTYFTFTSNLYGCRGPYSCLTWIHAWAVASRSHSHPFRNVRRRTRQSNNCSRNHDWCVATALGNVHCTDVQIPEISVRYFSSLYTKFILPIDRDNLRLSIKILYSLINVITNQRHVHLYKYMLSISS